MQSASPILDSLDALLNASRPAAEQVAPDSMKIGVDDSTSAVLDALAQAKKSQAAEAVSGVYDGFVDGLVGATGFSRLIITDLLQTLVVVVVLWLIRLLVLQVVNRRSKDVRVRYQWRKSTVYVGVVLGAFLLLRIWLGALGSLATFFGLLTAGIAIALKEPLANLAGWLFIVWKRPFAPGDRITVRRHTGDVIDQRVFMFTLLEVGTETGAWQSTGRIVHVPNGWIFSDSVVNFTRGFQYIWNEIAVLVPFESNWRKAKEVLLNLANEHGANLSEDAERKLRRAAQDYLIFYSKLTPTVYTSVRDAGVQLTIRYLVEPRRMRGSEQQIWEAILEAFEAEDDLAFAYPTTRVFRAVDEGKPGLRSPGTSSEGDGRSDVAPAPYAPPIVKSGALEGGTSEP